MKPVYKLPYSIDVNEWLDQPISLRFSKVGKKIPIPVSMIIMTTVVVILYILLAVYFWQHKFGVISIILFTIGYVPLCVMMLKKTNTGERGYKWLYPTLIYYPSYYSRKIETRSTANDEEVEKLQAIIPVQSVDTSGMVEYIDNSVGVVLKVIGNGSTTLFEKDKESVVDSFDSFLRDLKMNGSVTVEMRDGFHNCSSQKEYLDKQKEKTSNQTVLEINERKRNVLNTIEKSFTTVEYIVFLRFNTTDDLQSTIKSINSKRASNQMFKHVYIFNGEEAYTALKEFYDFG